MDTAKREVHPWLCWAKTLSKQIHKEEEFSFGGLAPFMISSLSRLTKFFLAAVTRVLLIRGRNMGFCKGASLQWPL